MMNATPIQDVTSAKSIVQTGDLIVDLDAETVTVNSVPVHLTGREYQVLELLSLHKGTTLTKEMFLDHLYRGMDEPELKVIDIFICKIRKKLANASNGKNYIGTVWGRGYVLREPEDELAGAQATTSTKDIQLRPRFVTGPSGSLMTIADLAPPGMKRWVVRRKAEIVAAVRGGLLTAEEACARYPGLSEDELRSWEHHVNSHGLAGLRVTRTQQYR